MGSFAWLRLTDVNNRKSACRIAHDPIALLSKASGIGWLRPISRGEGAMANFPTDFPRGKWLGASCYDGALV